MPGESLAGRGPQLQAVAMFRGHEFTRPSLLRLLGGVTVDFQPQQHTGASVTLYGARRKEASIMFILDCSNSMNAPITVEAPVEGLPQAETTRMEVAKFALQFDAGPAGARGRQTRRRPFLRPPRRLERRAADGDAAADRVRAAHSQRT